MIPGCFVYRDDRVKRFVRRDDRFTVDKSDGHKETDPTDGGQPMNNYLYDYRLAKKENQQRIVRPVPADADSGV